MISKKILYLLIALGFPYKLYPRKQRWYIALHMLANSVSGISIARWDKKVKMDKNRCSSNGGMQGFGTIQN